MVIILSSVCEKNVLWKGQIKTADGIMVYENPKTPMYTDPILTLSEDLCIGEEETRPEYMFYEISSIAVDREENIYVTDQGEKHIKVFDRDGIYLRTIGRPGQGPGEFGRPTETFITKDNKLAVTDPSRRQVHSYSIDGRYLESKKFKTVYPMRLVRDSEGNYYVMNWWREPGAGPGGFDLLKLNVDLDIVSTLVKVPISAEGKREEFDQIPGFAVGRDDCLVLGYTSNYTFEILSPEGETTKIVTKKYDLIPIPDEVKKKAEERDPGFAMEMPEYYQPFLNFFCDDFGRLFVLTAGDDMAELIYNCDVFDPEGRFLCSIPIKLSMLAMMTLAGDNLYVVDEDSEGNPVVKRYKISWKL
jgi:hypothetical protein